MKFIIMVSMLLIISERIFCESGGPLSAEQAAYDVKYYDLALTINPDSRTISGSLLCRAEILNPIDTLVLDLNNTLTIDSVIFRKGSGGFTKTSFTHSGGKIRISIPSSLSNGDIVSAKVFYNGSPKVNQHPPWDDGFVWSSTSKGKPWLGVACETEGADVWWPCKDHPTDEPDSMSMSFTVPNPLTCVSNGKFLGSKDNGNNTSTFYWFISTPINNYNVTFYAAEYSLIQDNYQSINGKTIPFYFWVLPEYYDIANSRMKVFLNEFNFLETICGPFPFGMDKHAFAHAPYWGMEHQTIVAYGHDFSINEWGYDFIHFHEMAHEWWGNLITAKDWSDIWIHEGIATYTEALYVEKLKGKSTFFEFMDIHGIANNHPYALAPRMSLGANEAMTFLDPYNRGAKAMHALRFYLGDEAFFKVLKGWAYPDSNDTDNTKGRLCRIVSTDDLKNDAEKISGIELDNFFEVFFRQKSFPVLRYVRGTTNASFTWLTGDIALDVDIPVSINGIIQKVEMINGKGTIEVKTNDHFMVDPEGWLIKTLQIATEVNDNDLKVNDYKLGQNYPNPFNPSTTILYEVPLISDVIIRVYDSLCQLVYETRTVAGSGRHKYYFDGSELSSGMYFYYMEADAIDGSDSFSDIKRMVMLK